MKHLMEKLVHLTPQTARVLRDGAEETIPAQVRAPIGEKIHILPLHPLPHVLALLRRVVQGDLLLYLRLAGLGIQHVAGAVKPQLTVLHTLPSLSWLEIVNYLPL